MASHPKISIITVISGNDVAFMASCFQSLISVTRYPCLEIIAVCDAGPATRDYLQAVANDNHTVRLFFQRHKSGNAANRNAGAALASADTKYLLFCDSDVLLSDPSWLQQLAEILEGNPNVGLIGSSNGTALGHFCWIDSKSGLLINNVMDFATALPDYPVEMMVVPGCCMLIRRSLFWKIGGWDDGFFPVYGEDIDLCLRCILAGSRVFSLHNPGVVHLYRNSGRNNSCERLSDDRRLWLTVASCRRLALKYLGILPSCPASSYQDWYSVLQTSLYDRGLEILPTKPLPPTIVNNRLNLLYLPTMDTDEICKIFESIKFDY